ncbi:MAG TPA: hypothetical protein PKD61_21700 [Polyangiaceae bacterium]|nr:hypothetical protein [Polyangiaceae bacterium]
MTIRFDRETFLALTAALASVGCAPAQQGKAESAQTDAPPAYDTTEGPQSVVTVAEPEQSDPEPIQAVEDPPLPSGCNNDEGDVDCSFVDPQRFSGPMCEGFSGSCNSLADGHAYKLRPAAAIARCYARKGPAVCNMRVRTQCIREGLEEACPDPQFNEFCADLLVSCQKRGRRPDFTAEQCVKTLSGIGKAEFEWAKSAMGSPSREGCKLMFPVY